MLHSENYIIVLFMGTFRIFDYFCYSCEQERVTGRSKSWMQDVQQSLLRFYEKLGYMFMLALLYMHKQWSNQNGFET